MEKGGVRWEPLQPRGGPMLLLPADIVAFLAPFAPLFSRPVWRHVQVLLVGAILAPGRRMVSSALRAVGLADLPKFQRYHRVLNSTRLAPRPDQTARFS